MTVGAIAVQSPARCSTTTTDASVSSSELSGSCPSASTTVSTSVPKIGLAGDEVAI